MQVLFLTGSLAQSGPEPKARSLGDTSRSRSINSKGLDQVDKGLSNLEVQSQLVQEHQDHGDILQGSFIDALENSTLKSLMGLNFVTNQCHDQAPKFIVKSQDDVFIEVFHLFKFVDAIYGQSPTRALVCDVIPQGVDGQPEHCNGLAYLMTPDLVREVLDISSGVSLMNINPDQTLYLIFASRYPSPTCPRVFI